MKRVVVDRSTRWHQLPPDPDQFAELELPGAIERRRPVVDLSSLTQSPGGLRLDEDTIAQFATSHHRELAYCAGASRALIYHLLCQAVLEPGDLALIPDPGEPRLRQGVILAGGSSVSYSLASRSGWKYDFAALRGDVARQARFIVVGWPHYPTAILPSVDDVKVLTSLALKENLLLVIDASHLQPSQSITSVFDFAELARCAVVLLRVAGESAQTHGLMIGHRDTVTAVATLLRSVEAECELASPAKHDSNPSQLRECRTLLRQSMERLPIDWNDDDSAPWLWGKIRKRRSSVPLVRLLHRRYGIKLIPGHAFGESATAWVAAGIPRDKESIAEIALRLNRRPKLLQLLGEEQR